MNWINTALQKIKRARRSRRDKAGLTRELAGLDLARLDDLGLTRYDAEVLLGRGKEPRPWADPR